MKHQANGTIECYKAQLVAWGDNQHPGIDYNQVFAPTARQAALRSILALDALAGEHIKSVDISNAYLNGELNGEHEVYMQQPEGFQQHRPNGEEWVCKLIKGLYGLKQSCKGNLTYALEHLCWSVQVREYCPTPHTPIGLNGDSNP